jgi:hypothetical protein
LLSSVELRDIRVGRSKVSLAVRRAESGSTGFSLIEQHGDVRVIMSA